MKLYTELKSLGFFEWLSETHNLSDTDMKPEYLDKLPLNDIHRTVCNAMVFRWFREKHNLRGFIGFRPNVKQFDYHICDMSLSGKEYVKQRTMEEFNKDPKVGTYEEAELECLKKLIEIVKGGNK
jgi:hypothetical protein